MKMSWRALFLAFVLVLRPLLGAKTPPNIVVIFTDDLGYSDLGVYGSELNRTPHLDRMAEEGVRFTSYYAAPICTAARAQILTGCYAKRVGLGGVLFPAGTRGISSEERTVASLLGEQGYATFMVGKWHLGDQPEFLPTRHGFDDFFGLPYSNDMGGPGGPGKRPPLPLLRGERVIEAPVDQPPLIERFTAESVRFIRDNAERPFFLYYAHTATHVPVFPGARFRGRSPHGIYSDWVEETDWSVGEILRVLQEEGLEENTLVIFTNDNGPWLGKEPNAGVSAPLRGGKFTSWEGGWRVPFIARWPGKLPPGRVVDAKASIMDILPTAVGLAGGTVPQDRIIDGRDIWPLLTGESDESPHEALFYWGRLGLEAVRSGPWKLIIAPQRIGPRDGDDHLKPASREEPLLYNLDEDISETTNLADKHPDVVARLLGLIDRMDGDLGAGRYSRGPNVRSAAFVENPVPLLLNPDE